MGQLLINLSGLIVMWFVWWWLASRRFSLQTEFVIAVLGGLAVLPLVLVGRRLLEKQPDIQQAERVTNWLHYALGTLLGAALIGAVRLGMDSTRWLLPLPVWLGVALMLLGGVIWGAVVFQLALGGLGHRFAIGLTRSIAVDWFYAWTRNPMTLSALAFLVGVAIWLQSSLVLLWVLAIFLPVTMVFLKVYEERELEIRFGERYLDYKDKTPWMLPTRRQPPVNGRESKSEHPQHLTRH